MHKNDLQRDALFAAKYRYEVSFGSDVPVHRRNLLFAATLAIASLMIAPKNGAYSVNLGVVAGEIYHAWMVYTGLLVVCIYQIWHFWVDCSSAVLNKNNFAGMRDTYFCCLAGLTANEAWNELTHQHSKIGDPAIGFNWEQNSSIQFDLYEAKGQITVEQMDRIPNLLKAIQDDERFRFQKSNGFYFITFVFKPTLDDQKYLHIHRDHFWLAKRKQFFDFGIPLIAGFIAVIGLVLKIAAITLA